MMPTITPFCQQSSRNGLTVRNPRPKGEYATTVMPSSLAAWRTPSAVRRLIQAFIHKKPQRKQILTSLEVGCPRRPFNLQGGYPCDLHHHTVPCLGRIVLCNKKGRTYFCRFAERIRARLGNTDILELALLAQRFKCAVRLFQAPIHRIPPHYTFIRLQPRIFFLEERTS